MLRVGEPFIESFEKKPNVPLSITVAWPRIRGVNADSMVPMAKEYAIDTTFDSTFINMAPHMRRRVRRLIVGDDLHKVADAAKGCTASLRHLEVFVDGSCADYPRVLSQM